MAVAKFAFQQKHSAAGIVPVPAAVVPKQANREDSKAARGSMPAGLALFYLLPSVSCVNLGSDLHEKEIGLH